MNRIPLAALASGIFKLCRVRKLLVATVFAMSFLVPSRMFAAGPAPVDLRSAAHFTILAGATITTTGGGSINGDIGASPITGAAIHLTQAQVNGTIYTVDAAGPAGSVIAPALLTTAKGDLTTAFNDAAGRLPAPTGTFLNPELVPGSGDFGGMTLVPGLYKFTGTAAMSGADVTLAGGPDDVWIFQIAADLQMGTSVHVILAGGAQARNIFWQVGTSAVIGTFAVFKGTIIADQSITINTTSAMDGRALAFSAGVTFNGNVGELPTPTAPVFTNISRTPTNVVLVLNTTPFFLVSLQATPELASPAWTIIATNTPSSSPWIFTDNTATAAVTQRFYRAFIATPN